MTYAYSTAARTVRMSITVQVPVDMYDRFEREKEQQKRSMSAIANDIFAAHFEAMDEENLVNGFTQRYLTASESTS